jgi:hypothetical protein
VIGRADRRADQTPAPEDEVSQPLEQKTVSTSEAPIGKLMAAIVAFIIVGGAAALYIWWDIDDLLAGKFNLVPTLIALALIGVFVGMLALWGKFLSSHTDLGA